MSQQKRIFCLGLIGLLVWLMPAVSSTRAGAQQTANEKAAEGHVKRGNALLDKGNLDGALVEFR